MRAIAIVVLLMPSLARAQAPEILLQQAKLVLAQLDGDFTLPVKEPVEVVRDRWGIPHIYAKNADDLFFAQGFIAAQDRLFQIDLWRRQATGELAEVFGPSHVEADTFARLLKYRGDMNAEWTSYSPDTKAIATAFTNGINAYIDHIKDKLPIEFQMLGYRPKRWQPEDVLGRSSGIYMSQNFRNEVERTKLLQLVGVEKARWLAPIQPARDYVTHLSPDDLKHFDAKVLAGYKAATKALQFTTSKSESNNWVVDGAHSASGKPLLASDPHRATAMPSLRYLVHLNAPGWNVIGAGEPGLPGVAVGHNEKIAWGFTIIGTDQADIVVESTHSRLADRYKVGSGWESLRTVTETIAVKGKPAQAVQLQYTHQGPVLFHDKARHKAYVLRWAGNEPGGAAYLGSLAVARAKNQQEFLKALQSWHIPGLNFVYADVEGTIGWVAAAFTPKRTGYDGVLPVPGNSGYEWERFLRIDELPQTFNPKEGFVATANHNIMPKDYRNEIGYEFSPPFRFRRLHELLSAKPMWKLEDFKALQQDAVSLPARALVQLLKNTGVLTKNEEAAKLFLKWDGHMAVDSQAALLYALWLKELEHDFFALGYPAKSGIAFETLAGLPTMLTALETADPRWLGDDGAETRADLLLQTLDRAVTKMRTAYKGKTWGEVHTVTFRHSIASLSKGHAAAFNVGPLQRPGEANTPNNTKYDANFQQIHGASYRHLFDLSDWDLGLATSAPGQSGQLGSPHYADLAPLWARGEYFPLYYTRTKVDEAAAHRMVLKP